MPTGLIRRSGRYSTRRVIPLDLQPSYGRREVVRALGTADPAEARRLHAMMWVELDREFAAKRAELRPAAEPPLPRATEISPTVVGLVNLDRLREERDRAAATGELPAFMREQREALVVIQGMLDGEVPATRDLRELEGLRNGLRAFLTGDGSFSLAAARASKAAAVQAQRKGTPLSAVVDRWAAERKPTERTIRRTRNVVARFEAVNGKLDVEQVTKQHVLAFKDALLEEGQSAANINVMIPMLGTVLIYAMDNDLIGTNPATRIRVADNRRAKEKRREFSTEALNTIFSSPVYTEDKRPVAGAGEAAYWLPLLGLYTGARLNELGQLHPGDIVGEVYRDAADEEQSAWVIRLVEDQERGQQLKTEGSERRIPVHADLIALGFLKFVADAKAKRRPRLFYQLRPDRDGILTGNWSKWFGRYRRKELGLTGKDTPFHSFRHSFKHYARLSEIPSEVHNELTGHETGDVADAYGGLSYPLLPLVQAMKRYRVPGLKLPAPPPAYR